MIQLPNKKVEEVPKKPVIISDIGLGKNSNQAIQVMIAQGYFVDSKPLHDVVAVYKELTKLLYRTDIECKEELKKELEGGK